MYVHMFYHPSQVTTIKVLTDRYQKFKVTHVDDKGLSLQCLVNRALFLYETDKDFRKKLDTTTDLQVSGSVL